MLAVMRTTPRHLFAPPEAAALAYEDRPLPIGYGQTISQPFIVAVMTERLGLAAHHRVLEIGSGSGYQAAILAQLAAHVTTLEIVPELAARAAATLHALGYHNVEVHHADGYLGWPPGAPYDRILLTAAPEAIPPALVAQLRTEGRLIAPAGRSLSRQRLLVLDKDASGHTSTRAILPVRFVPMVRPHKRLPG